MKAASPGDPRRPATVAAIEKERLSRRDRFGLRGPDDEALDVRVGLQTLLVLLRDEIQAAGTELRVVDGRQRVEDRPVERPPHFERDIGRGLFADLLKDDRRL